jgi:hypothetical protein
MVQPAVGRKDSEYSRAAVVLFVHLPSKEIRSQNVRSKTQSRCGLDAATKKNSEHENYAKMQHSQRATHHQEYEKRGIAGEAEPEAQEN